MKEYKDFLFEIRNYEIVQIYANGKLVTSESLLNTNLWDKYKNVDSLLYFHIKGWSKKKNRHYEYYPYRFPLILPNIDMDEAEYQTYMRKCYERLHGDSQTYDDW